MIKTLTLPTCETPAMALERVNYFPRQLLTVDDMVTESEYFRQKLRRHNLFLHGWGIVCGLEVKEAPEKNSSTIKISAGYALGPYGDEIYVAEPVFFDLARCGPDDATDPCEPSKPLNGSGVGATVYVVIKYAECFARPVRAMPAGCACDEEDCQYSRVRDSFQISCLTETPPPPKPASLCELIAQKLIPCPPCEISPWVLLAQVKLPSVATGGRMTIVTSMRPVLVSTTVLQKQLIDCCCAESADLEITKVVDPTNVSSGLFPFTITVTNHGPSTATKVTVTDSLGGPTGISVTKLQPSDERWNPVQNDPLTYVAVIDSLKNGETTRLLLTVSGSPQLTNVAVVKSETFDPNTNNNRASYPINILNPF